MKSLPIYEQDGSLPRDLYRLPKPSRSFWFSY
jgi:hypothetical protein